MSTRQTRILVVDDNELNLKLLRRVLELEGHEVTAAASIADAVRAIAETDPALIVLDLGSAHSTRDATPMFRNRSTRASSRSS